MALYDQFGGDPPKKKAEQIIIGRLLKKKLSTDKDYASDIIKRVAGKTGLKPSFLAANALQEGMNMAIYDDNQTKSEGYYEQGVDENRYPVDGFLAYGVDTFGDNIDVLKKKGYISKDFDYMPYRSYNEKRQPITTGAFRNNEEALMAKSALMRHFMDQVKDYASKKNMKLDDNSLEYLTMSAYNGGMGNAKIIADEMAKSNVSPREFISKGMTSRKGVHKNIVPRIEKMKWIEGMITGPVAPLNPFPMSSDIIRSIYKQ